MSEKSEPNTSTPVQHPPREVGQVWKWGDGPPRTLTKCRVPPWGGELWSTTDGVDVAMCGDLVGWVFISPAEPAVDRTGCLAPEWCGIHKILPNPGRDAHFFAYRGPYELADDHLYCSPACRDARVPLFAPAAKCESFQTAGCDGGPYQQHSVECGKLCDAAVESYKKTAMPAPVETRCLKCGYESTWAASAHDCKPAPCPCESCESKPVPVVQAPACLGCRKVSCNHGYVMCEQGAGGWGRRETMGAVMLHETTLPERLTPARLAHSMQIEDDTLEDC